jgi:hypothetical protein
MNELSLIPTLRAAFTNRAVSGLVLLLAIPACGGATTSGVAVGKVGHDLSGHAHAVPQGAEICVLQEALAAPPGVPEKPISDACNKALKSDLLWRRSLVVLAAYSDTLETIASGENTDQAGGIEAAMTGVSGDHWVDVEGSEAAARDADNQLVDQMSKNSAKGDLAKAVKDAAPQVQILCDGLGAYLEAQGKSLADIQANVEKRRIAHTEHRCGTLDTRSICVSDSVLDRLGYANLFGSVAAMESSHEDAKEAVAGFCAAHHKLEDAAAKGNLSKDQTYRDVVEAVRSVPRMQPQASSPGAKQGAPAKEAPPPSKK